MDPICYSSRYSDSMLGYNSRKRQRNQYSPVQYQEISPPLTDCTDLSTEGFVPQSLVTPSPSTFSVGNTDQDLSRRSTLDSQHMWNDSTPVNDDFTLEGWRSSTQIPQSDDVNNAIPLQFNDYRFNFEFPHQGTRCVPEVSLFRATDYVSQTAMQAFLQISDYHKTQWASINF